MDDVRSRLIGVWRVTRYDDRDSTDAPWTPTYGADVNGLIIYHESGWLSVSVAGEGRFDAYLGRFEIIEASAETDDVVGIVNHEIVATSMPELLAIDQSRPFGSATRHLCSAMGRRGGVCASGSPTSRMRDRSDPETSGPGWVHSG